MPEWNGPLPYKAHWWETRVGLDSPSSGTSWISGRPSINQVTWGRKNFCKIIITVFSYLPVLETFFPACLTKCLTIFRGVRHRTHQNYKVSVENNSQDSWFCVRNILKWKLRKKHVVKHMETHCIYLCKTFLRSDLGQNWLTKHC